MNIPGILDYLFYFENENKENYTHEDDYIFLFCYIRGVRTIIKIKNSFPSFKNKEQSLIYKDQWQLNPKLNLIFLLLQAKIGVLLGQILIKAFIFINYFSQNIINEIEANKYENIYLTYNIEKDDEKNYKKLCDDSYLFSKKYEILDEGLFHEYPMNIFLGCISEIIK